jgi:excinuclease ABC subunit A
MKLARELSKRQTGRTLYLLDEPTTGLHFDDVRKLLEVLHRLANLGNSVIIIEHNLDVIRNGDWIIDLGPEGGEDGGRIVGEGRPARVAATPGSYTGQFLSRYYTSENGRLEPLDVDFSLVDAVLDPISNTASEDSRNVGAPSDHLLFENNSVEKAEERDASVSKPKRSSAISSAKNPPPASRNRCIDERQRQR